MLCLLGPRTTGSGSWRGRGGLTWHWAQQPFQARVLEVVAASVSSLQHMCLRTVPVSDPAVLRCTQCYAHPPRTLIFAPCSRAAMLDTAGRYFIAISARVGPSTSAATAASATAEAAVGGGDGAGLEGRDTEVRTRSPVSGVPVRCGDRCLGRWGDTACGLRADVSTPKPVLPTTEPARGRGDASSVDLRTAPAARTASDLRSMWARAARS